MLRLLYAFKAEHGHCRVPQKHVTSSSSLALGAWVNKQRMVFKPYLDNPELEHSVTVAERLCHLRNVGFEWAKSKGDALWNERYEELRQFHKREGHCNVPTKYHKNQPLGRWVTAQRSQFLDFQHGNPRTRMTQERIDQLNALQFAWDGLDAMYPNRHTRPQNWWRRA